MDIQLHTRLPKFSESMIFHSYIIVSPKQTLNKLRAGLVSFHILWNLTSRGVQTKVC